MTITVPGDKPSLARRSEFHLRDMQGHTLAFFAAALYLPIHFVAPPDAAGARQYLIVPLDEAERTLS